MGKKNLYKWTHTVLTHVVQGWWLFSHSVISVSLWPHGLQHTRLPCSSLSPGVCSTSCPLSRWCHPTISSSIIPFSSCPQSFPGSKHWFFTSSGQSIGASALASVLPMIIQGWFPCCPRDSQGFSPALQFESISSLVFSLLYSPALITVHDHWEDHRFDYTNLIGRIMSLLFNIPSRFVMLSCQEANTWFHGCRQHPQWFLKPNKRKSVTASTFSPSLCHKVTGFDIMIFFFNI